MSPALPNQQKRDGFRRSAGLDAVKAAGGTSAAITIGTVSTYEPDPVIDSPLGEDGATDLSAEISFIPSYRCCHNCQRTSEKPLLRHF